MLQSKLKQIYDFTSFVVPEELAINQVKIGQLVDEALSFLSKKHVTWMEADGPVAAEDIVTVRIDSNNAEISRDSMQISVGIGFNKAVEEHVRGLKKGEIVTRNINDTPAKIQVLSIKRKSVPSLTDAFIRGLNMDNIHTITDYKAHLHNEFSEQMKKQHVFKIAQVWIKEGIEKSEFEISEQDIASKFEKVKEMAAKEHLSYEAYIQNYASMDLKNPTVEESEAYMAKSLVRGIKENLLGQYFASGDDPQFSEACYEEELKELSNRENKPIAILRETYSYQDYLQQKYTMSYYNHVLDLSRARIGLTT